MYTVTNRYVMKEFYMKVQQILVLIAFAVISLGIMGCASQPAPAQPTPAQPAPAPVVQREVVGSIPDFVRNAILNREDDTLVAIGTAAHPNPAAAMASGQFRGRMELSRQIEAFIEAMITDLMEGDEGNTEMVTFFEQIGVELIDRNMQGSVPADMDFVNGRFWVVMALGGFDAEGIRSATYDAMGRFAGERAVAQDAIRRMDERQERVQRNLNQTHNTPLNVVDSYN